MTVSLPMKPWSMQLHTRCLIEAPGQVSSHGKGRVPHKVGLLNRFGYGTQLEYDDGVSAALTALHLMPVPTDAR